MFELLPQRRRQEVESNYIQVNGFSRGLNTFSTSPSLEKLELNKALNYYLNKKGQLVPRTGVSKFTTSAMDGSPYDLQPFTINGTPYDIVSTSTSKIYKVDRTGTVTLIGTVAGPAILFIYNNLCVICDGSYIKYLTSSGDIAMAYDAGDNSGFYDKLDETATDEFAIYSGQSAAGTYYPAPTFTGSYNLPFTTLKARVKKVGSPTGTMVARVYDGNDVLVTSIEQLDVSGLLTTEQTVLFNFTVDASDQSKWLQSGQLYRYVLEYLGGDGSNHVSLSSIDDGDLNGTYYNGIWNDNEKSPLMWLAPSLAPKAEFGTVALKRPFFGGDEDNPGYVWYGNISIFDFSTDNGGGFVGVIDDDRSSYPVAGLGVLYGNLYAFGTQAQQYLSKLTGAEPQDFVLADTYKNTSANHRTIVNQPNNIWFSRRAGTNDLQGVLEFGDLRTYSQAESIIDRFDDYWGDGTSNNFAGFYEDLNLYMLQLEDYDRTLICHTAIPFQQSNVEADVGYPWTEYKFQSTPTMFKEGQERFIIGLADGYLYEFDSEALKDDGVDIEYIWRTAFIELPIVNVDLDIIRLLVASKGGLGFDLNIYTNYNRTNPTQVISAGVAQDGLLVEDATMLVDDADILLDTGSNLPVYPINIRCQSVQIEGSECRRLFPTTTDITGCIIRYKSLEK